MPYRDVTLTIEWGPVDGASTTPTEDLALGKARAEAVDAINNAYAGYRSANYDDGNWNALVNAKNSGIENVRSATTVELVAAAKEQAIIAMAAVEIKTFTGSTPFGKVVGNVDVYVEKNIFGGAHLELS